MKLLQHCKMPKMLIMMPLLIKQIKKVINAAKIQHILRQRQTQLKLKLKLAMLKKMQTSQIILIVFKSMQIIKTFLNKSNKRLMLLSVRQKLKVKTLGQLQMSTLIQYMAIIRTIQDLTLIELKQFLLNFIKKIDTKVINLIMM